MNNELIIYINDVLTWVEKNWIGLITLLLVIFTYLKMISGPLVKVYFWNNTTKKRSNKMTVESGKSSTLCFLFRNEGKWLDFWKPAATRLTAFIYFPESFMIIEARRYEAKEVKTSEVFQASPSGRFKKTNYIAIPSAYKVFPPAISILSYKEDVLVNVDINIPDTANSEEEIVIQMTSKEGDLGVHKLCIKVNHGN